MLRYAILISKDPAAAAPAADHYAGLPRVHAVDRASVYARAPAPPVPWVGAALRDGYRLGLSRAPARSVGEVLGDWGAYVLLRRAADGAVAVARDPSGRVPAYWRDLGHQVVVASHVGLVLDGRGAPPGFDWEYLTLMAAGLYLPSRRTGYAGVQEIVPGRELVVGREAADVAYWRPASFYGRPLRTARSVRTRLRAAAEASAAFWASQYDRMALDLSGGLDSSIVLGLLARSAARPELICLNAMVGHAESDERAYARAAADLHGVRLVERLLDSETIALDVRSDDELQPRPTTRLLGIGFGEAGLEVARSAGAQAYATGRGGDHVFGAYLPAAAVRDRLREDCNLPGWLRYCYLTSRRTGRPFLSLLRDSLSGFDRDATARRHILHASEFVKPEAVAGVPVAGHMHPWLEEALEAASEAKLTQVVNLIELQRHYDRIGRAAEIDEVHPFIAQPVFEASLATPSHRFALDEVDRSLQREVFKDLLPPLIYGRREKGGTTSHSLRVYRRNVETVRTLLMEGELARRGVIDRRQVEARLTPLGFLDGRFGSKLKYALVAELWIQRALNAQRPAAAPLSRVS